MVERLLLAIAQGIFLKRSPPQQPTPQVEPESLAAIASPVLPEPTRVEFPPL
ncbi:hypothetical protein KR51_00027760 [Rubidibacter lacunae KORDI 51-2]|uniref:Uncharacterized protein n=1 Tax=Rubidibacter lacunae KORDI 51-2 TaxID=582515 RepID=U5DIL7_9CHRO|nr:hypothetical protein [Rubidibacter lacunae]ERN40787.1 hypothetical protein KR51_00027760 [Rubidibacter lacunae KORDI 51-2]